MYSPGLKKKKHDIYHPIYLEDNIHSNLLLKKVFPPEKVIYFLIPYFQKAVHQLEKMMVETLWSLCQAGFTITLS